MDPVWEMRVSNFSVVKKQWRSILTSYFRKTQRKTIRKLDFPGLLENLFSRSFSTGAVCGGFKRDEIEDGCSTTTRESTDYRQVKRDGNGIVLLVDVPVHSRSNFWRLSFTKSMHRVRLVQPSTILLLLIRPASSECARKVVFFVSAKSADDLPLTFDDDGDADDDSIRYRIHQRSPSLSRRTGSDVLLKQESGWNATTNNVLSSRWTVRGKRNSFLFVRRVLKIQMKNLIPCSATPSLSFITMSLLRTKSSWSS